MTLPTPTFIDRVDAVLAPLIPLGATVALFDFPNHGNVGDSAIWLGEERYLSQRNVRPAIVDEARGAQVGLPPLSDSTIVLIHGGGNFGDLYPHHQLLRERLATHYRAHRIIQLPQSIHFQSSEAMHKAGEVFCAHPDFHLLVRDRESLDLGRRLHDGPTLLCPDMALCLGELERSAEPVHPIFGLLRTDQERVASSFELPDAPTDFVSADWRVEPISLAQRMSRLVERLRKDYPRRVGGMYSLKRRLYHRLADERFRRGCALLSSGQVVVTDRLHAHILCTMMAIPHVVLDNSYRKIANFRDAWNTAASLCQTAATLDEALSKARAMLHLPR